MGATELTRRVGQREGIKNVFTESICKWVGGGGAFKSQWCQISWHGWKKKSVRARKYYFMCNLTNGSLQPALRTFMESPVWPHWPTFDTLSLFSQIQRQVQCLNDLINVILFKQKKRWFKNIYCTFTLLETLQTSPNGFKCNYYKVIMIDSWTPISILPSIWDFLPLKSLSCQFYVAKKPFRIIEYLQQNFWTWVWSPKKVKKFGQGSPHPPFRAMSERKHFFCSGGLPLPYHHLAFSFPP